MKRTTRQVCFMHARDSLEVRRLRLPQVVRPGEMGTTFVVCARQAGHVSKRTEPDDVFAGLMQCMGRHRNATHTAHESLDQRGRADLPQASSGSLRITRATGAVAIHWVDAPFAAVAGLAPIVHGFGTPLSTSDGPIFGAAAPAGRGVGLSPAATTSRWMYNIRG